MNASPDFATRSAGPSPGDAGIVDAPPVVLLAAGLSSRFGRSKILEPVGPGGETLLDLSIRDARGAGFGPAIVVARAENAEALRTHLEAQGHPGVHIVIQSVGDLVGGDGEGVALRRARPWGTGHAVLSARSALPPGRAFAVANGDDAYGRDAWVALGRELSRRSPEEGVLLSYPAGATLSDSGGVSRGRVELDPSDPSRVVAIRELREVRSLSREGPRTLTGIDPEGRRVSLAPSEPVSMNLWGLPAGAIPRLTEAWSRFLRSGPGEEAEFAISTALDALVRAGSIRIRHLPAGRRWAGLTHPGDRAGVVAALAGFPHDDPLPGTRSGAETPPDRIPHPQ